MKLRPEDLPAHLNNPLAKIYVLSGDEPLQLGEAADAIRAAARKQNYVERHVMHIEKSFDWGHFYQVANSFSLFSERQLIELRMPTGKPGDKGVKALLEYVDNPPDDSVLLIISGKLDRAAQRSKWFVQLEKHAVFIQVWPVEANHLAGWIQQRMRRKGMKASSVVVHMLVERVEGNLLAAAQEIDKLFLLYGSDTVDEQALMDSVADSARFDVYGLVDAALIGDKTKTVRILQGLRAEGVEPVLIVWALSREIRAMNQMAGYMASGMKAEQVVAQAKVWPKRKFAVTAGLKRHNCTEWRAMLQHAARIDRMVKGMLAGNMWNELLQLTSKMAGLPLFRQSIANSIE